MRVLVACEESQVVTIAFRAMGHEAWSCDIIPCSGGHPEYHLQCDVRDILSDGWDMIIAHPPCTRLCNSGVSWLARRNLWEEMAEGARFFKTLLDAKIKRKCIENPIPHKYAMSIIGIKYSQIIQPWMFGHGETKATCLWLEGLDKLVPTDIVAGREQRIWRMGPSVYRTAMRSKTYHGIADAMAKQWGAVV